MVVNSVYAQETVFNRLTLKKSEIETTKYGLAKITTNSIFNNKPFLYAKKSVLDRKPVWVPASEILGLNALVGSYNTYISKKDWAKISFKTVGKNLTLSPIFDEDLFETNFFQHPYHGNLYFNAARSNGYSFWWSTLFSLGGSTMWEYVMENTRPSWNDLINTTVSGYMLGEITHRISNLVLGIKGKNCIANIGVEALAGAINPMQLLNRLIRKELGNHAINKNGELENKTFSDFFLYAGYSSLENYHTGKSGVLGGNINYGDVFKTNDISGNRKPFGVFRVNYNLNLFNNQRDVVNNVNAYALLFGKNYFRYLRNDNGTGSIDTESNLLLGFFQHYDYWQNRIYQFGGISFGPGLIAKHEFTNYIKNYSRFFFNIMPLGGANSVYRPEGEKNYSFCFGANAKIESRFDILNELFKLYILIDGYWYHIFKVANKGQTGNEFVGIFRPKLIISPPIKYLSFLSAGIEYLLYGRLTSYDFPVPNSSRIKPVQEYRVFIGFNLKSIYEDLL